MDGFLKRAARACDDGFSKTVKNALRARAMMDFSKARRAAREPR
tara:strand:+ start:340 stop:471 length:132 start_codon:yes stop_codon:yes gene_type:complete